LARFYTVRQANAILPELTRLLKEMQAQGQRLAQLKMRSAEVKKKVQSNGNHNPAEDVLLARSEKGLEDALRSGIEQLAEWNVQLKDLERGLVDFPAVREGRTIFLCWELGESEVGFWHETSTGFAGRQPLDDRIN